MNWANEGVAPLKTYFQDSGLNRLLLFTGKDSFASVHHFVDPMLAAFQYERIQVKGKVPTYDEIVGIIESVDVKSFDAIVAIGGGKIMDTAKATNVLASQSSDDYLAYLDDPGLIKHKGLPLIAIPTTAGSGSEATQFAVVYKGATKYSLSSATILPDHSLIDASLIENVPAAVAASTGFDVLCQSIESYWSVNSNSTSKPYSTEAINLIQNNLVAYLQDNTLAARMNMVKAAHLAGKAINITRTTAPHALSYGLTHHFGIPHGHAVSILLPQVAKLSFAKTMESETEGDLQNLWGILGVGDVEGFLVYWEGLMNECGLETRLSVLGVGRSDLEGLARGVNVERLGNHPVKLSVGDLEEVLVGCW